MELAPGSRAVSIVAAWTDAPAVRPVRSTLRPIAFERLEIAASTSAEDAIVAAVLDAHPAVELPLAVRLPAASVQRITVPRHALYFATGAGAAEAEPDGDAWTPAGGQMGPIGLDLAPRTLLLRNSAFARVRPYLYRPNATALTAAVGVAAVTLILVVRRRTAPPERG
jgi:hypothetical protein